MNVSLTPALEKMIHQKVASGYYNSASEVIREALRMMIENDKAQLAKLTALREDIEVGIRQLEAGQYTEFAEESASDLIEQIKSKRKK